MDAAARAHVDALVESMLARVGEAIALDARRLAPKDTGNLADSISVDVHGADKVTITDTAEYARYVELGTRYMEPEPYLRPALYRKRSV
jgi:HK97 gp10 family phage protein